MFLNVPTRVCVYRQLALKALNERLSKVQSGGAQDSEWPSLEQDEAESSAVSSVEPATSDSNTPGTHTPPPQTHQQQQQQQQQLEGDS